MEKQFLILILFTAVFDIYILITHPLSGFVKLVTLLLALLKLPIFFTCLAQLRERGGDLFWGQASAGFHGLGMPRGGQASEWTRNFGMKADNGRLEHAG